MSLFRCTQLLKRPNGSFLCSFKNSVAFYSDDTKSSDDGATTDEKPMSKKTDDKKPSKQTKGSKIELSSDTQNRLNALLKKLSSRSTLDIVKNVQASKPLGYRNIRQNQKLDAVERKPRSLSEAAKAVSKELGNENVKDEILKPFDGEHTESGFMDDVISKMKTPAKRKEKTSKTPLTGEFTPENTQRESVFKRRKPLQSDGSGSEEKRFNQRAERFNQKAERFNQKDRSMAEVDVFAGQPIGIFESADQLKSKEDSLKTWRKLEQHELHLRMSMAPRNYFEKMAYWTEEGKIWHFPIDNEQGLDEELQTSFTEHIFLEEHLEPWCPKKGAVRNFMELVCTGLSKNPYLSVQQKREHIEYYKNYFEENKDILQRVIEENKKNVEQIGNTPQSS